LNSKGKAAGIGAGLILANALLSCNSIGTKKRIKESEMYSLGVMHGQQQMRKKMLSQLDHLLEEMRYDN